MKKKKLLSVNVHYAPRSFGGATIVAEQVNALLALKHHYEVLVVTTTQNNDLVVYHTEKYQTNQVTVIAINIPKKIDYLATYQNEEIANVIRNIVEAYQPDVAHLHSIQRLGATFIRVLKQQKVPIFATLHDCWWICERQFMINKHERYCFQSKIDPSVCLHCVDDVAAFERRQNYLNNLLSKIDYYLYPSQFHKELHLVNGLPKDRSFVNKNGIKPPDSSYKKTASKVVRFGFVGGPGKIKGAPIIQAAFESIEASNYELIVVDGAQNIGKSWKRGFVDWKIKGKMAVVPAYTQETMDEYYKNIDVLLFPSQWKESFGLTVREALIRDIFIISTNGGGTVEDLVEGDNAYIIPITTNEKPLKDAILKVLAKDWTKYKNPHKKNILTYKDQAIELDRLFKMIPSKKIQQPAPIQFKKPFNKLFLGAGVMKAGTTWLYNILKDHPEIYFSPEKEIHFWADAYGDSNYLSIENRVNKVKVMLERASKYKNINQYRRLLRWSHIYLKPQIDEEWYRKLFVLNNQDNRYNADFSNVTCHISAEGWQKARAISEQLRVIYVLRDPLERLWSHIKFHHQFAGKSTDFDKWSKKDFRYFIQRPHVWRNCEYAKWIELMRENLEENEFKILYFEDFRANPQEQFKVLEDFLGIKHHDYPAAKVQKKVNPSKSIPMPENYRKVATSLLKEEIQKLKKANVSIHPTWNDLS